jgi:hypothetical protein
MKIVTTAILRKTSAEKPRSLTRVVKNKVKKVKLAIKPTMIPNGRRLPPVNDPDKTIGRIGKMQGERMVTIPPKKEKIIRMIILFGSIIAFS